MGRSQVNTSVLMPDGTRAPIEYTEGLGGRMGTRREADRLEDAKKKALKDWEREQGAQAYWDNFNTDYFGGLDQYLPDYDDLLYRGGSSYSDIMGRESQAADAYGQGADQFQDIYDQGGYTGLERGQIQQAQFQANTAEKSQRDAQQQQMRMRGMGGSGLEAMSGMNAQQQGANRGLAAATGVATAAQQRALQALQSGTAMRGQQGAAADAFNAANLGWQDQQQGLAGQWQQQALQNQGQLAGMQENQRRYQMGAAQSVRGDDATESSPGADGFAAGAGAVDAGVTAATS